MWKNTSWRLIIILVRGAIFSPFWVLRSVVFHSIILNAVTLIGQWSPTHCNCHSEHPNNRQDWQDRFLCERLQGINDNSNRKYGSKHSIRPIVSCLNWPVLVVFSRNLMEANFKWRFCSGEVSVGGKRHYSELQKHWDSDSFFVLFCFGSLLQYWDKFTSMY